VLPMPVRRNHEPFGPPMPHLASSLSAASRPRSAIISACDCEKLCVVRDRQRASNQIALDLVVGFVGEEGDLCGRLDPLRRSPGA
jgi:hypothetical protein